MANSTYNFTHLDPRKWEAKDCTQIIQIWTYIEHNRTEEYELYSKYGTNEQIHQYIVQGFVGFLASHSLQVPPASQAFWDWFIQEKEIFLQKILPFGIDNCISQVCEAIGWEGSPDVVGVGMLATYVIQAILVTLYLFAILAVRRDKLPPQLWSSRMLSRTLLSMQHSTAEFLSASSMFSISILIASILSIRKWEDLDIMTWIFALVIPVNSILPVAILHISASEMLRRSKGRVLMWLVIFILAVGLTVRSLIIFEALSVYDGVEETSPCVQMSFRGIAILSYTIAGFLGLGMTGYIVDSVVSLVRNRPRVIARLPNMIQIGVIGFCMCTMWGFIGWLLYLATRIESRAGDSNKDSEWTFGQVLALATWAPFMIEFAYIWWENPLEAMNGRLMAPYEVVVSSGQQNLLEVQSSGGEERGLFQILE